MNNAVIVALCGGLGNMMFQIANGAYYAELTKRNLFVFFKETNGINFERRKKYTDFIKNYNVLTNIPPNTILYSEGPSHLNLINVPTDVDRSVNVLFDGYFQDESYFTRDIATRLFLPTKDIENKIYSAYGDLREFVSINTRRGDYVGLGWSLSREYYLHAYNKHFKDKPVIVIGEDVEWNKHNISIPNAVYAKCDDPLVDLYINYYCGDSILYNGTFCWWGAYLSEDKFNNKKIIIPETWDNNLCYNNKRWIKEK